MQVQQGTLRRMLKNRRNRRKNNMVNLPQPTIGISIVSTSAAGSVLTIEFDGPVSLKGTPAYTTDIAGAVAVSAVAVGPDTIDVTFDMDVSAATVVNVPYEDHAVRNSSGGFVAPSGFPF